MSEERWAAVGEGIPLGRAATPDEIAGAEAMKRGVGPEPVVSMGR